MPLLQRAAAVLSRPAGWPTCSTGAWPSSPSTSSCRARKKEIIPKRNLDQEKNNELNEKIRVIDYSKINGSEKKLKNKFGIDKIKIVYFD